VDPTWNPRERAIPRLLAAVLVLATPSCVVDDEEDDEETCTAPCERLYGSESDQCNLQVPGVDDQDALVDECVAKCEDAAAEDGDLGDYDPNRRVPASEEVVLENAAQVEAWAECIEMTSCEILSSGGLDLWANSSRADVVSVNWIPRKEDPDTRPADRVMKSPCYGPGDFEDAEEGEEVDATVEIVDLGDDVAVLEFTGDIAGQVNATRCDDVVQ
jgi:hypothetical protein